PSISRHSRSPDSSTLTLAKWVCGASHRLNPPRVPRPHRRVWAPPPVSCVVLLRRILQSSPHASIPRQGRTDPTCCSSGRPHSGAARSWRVASGIRADLIYDRDTYSIATFLPSTYPVSLTPRGHDAMR